MPRFGACDGALAYRLAAPGADHYFLVNDGPATAVRLRVQGLARPRFEDAVSGEVLASGRPIALEAHGGRWRPGGPGGGDVHGGPQVRYGALGGRAEHGEAHADVQAVRGVLGAPRGPPGALPGVQDAAVGPGPGQSAGGRPQGVMG